MSKLTRACKAVNLMLERAEETKDCTFFKTQSDPGWLLCMDFFDLDATWPDNDVKSRVVESLGGGEVHLAQIYVCNEEEPEIIDPSIEVGVKVEDGKAVAVEPFSYESQTTTGSVTIDYDGRMVTDGIIGYDERLRKGELKKRFNNFMEAMLGHVLERG